MASFIRDDKDEAELAARLRDHLFRTERGEYAASVFYDPEKARICREFLRREGRTEGRDYIFFGGYPEAERKMLFLFPAYAAELYSDPADEAAYLEGEARSCGRISVVRIDGSGYRALSHRDYLGSLMGLGIERPVVGDIVPYGPHGAAVFFCGKIAEYVVSELTRIGADRVTCTSLDGELAAGTLQLNVQRECRIITDTVASLRLDCVAAAILNLPRERAQSLIRAGMVEVDFAPCDKTDRQVTVPCVLSVRGYGRYELEGTDGETKKGRIRIKAKKYL